MPEGVHDAGAKEESMTKMKRAEEYNSFVEIVEELRAISKDYRQDSGIITAATKWKGEPLDRALEEIATAIMWLEREK